MRRRIIALAVSMTIVAAGALTMVLRPAYAATACTVEYKILREWSLGWTAEMTLTNLGPPATDWRLRWRLPAYSQRFVPDLEPLPPGYTIIAGTHTPNDPVLIPPAGHTLPTGGSVTVRWGGHHSGENPPPTNYSFNSQPCNTDGSTPSPTISSPPPGHPDPTPPSVTMTSPQPDDFFAAPATIPIRVDATAAPGRHITRVEFKNRGVLLNVDTAPPYAFDWRGVPENGGTRISATAFDNTGAATAREAIGVRVIPPPAPGEARSLHVTGARIVTVERDPRPFRARGVARSTVEAGCPPSAGFWDGSVDDASVRALRARGVNTVRMVLSDACWPSSGHTAVQDRDAYLAEVAAYARRLIRHGITPIVAPRATTAANLTSFWLHAARVFRDDNAVVFDLVVGVLRPETQYLVDQIRRYGAFNVILVGGLDDSNDLSGWLAHRPTDRAGRSLAAAWQVDNNSACATPACWRTVLLPLAAQVPVVATDVSAGASASRFVPHTVDWLSRHGIGHVLGDQ
ncbi:Ig-like domain-containing protein [Micromonospora sp. CPCC 206061]|uniref:Ig-like domain-containing protein n=1 Tax=Micromonospora sp. CPCC 206061 TaxID=3122410 RepID=UPI002FF1A3F0